jgi:hypothetical protein
VDSGWALVVVEGRQCVGHGLVRRAKERQAVVAQALARAAVEGGRLLVVLEDHAAMPLSRLTRFDPATKRKGRQGAPERSTRSILGQGKSLGRWHEQLDLYEHPEALRLGVEPRVWRRRVHGVVAGDVKGAALGWAAAALGVVLSDHDEAEACGIAMWGAVDGVQRAERERAIQRLYARGKRNERRQLELGEVR